MTDEEIITKRLSDWKPETDIKLQKAFGKFVEEAGELMEIGWFISTNPNRPFIAAFENELADTLAFAEIIEDLAELKTEYQPIDHQIKILLTDTIRDLGGSLGILLSIIGRCQIQGLNGKHPDTKIPNRKVLSGALYHFVSTVKFAINCHGLNGARIEKRKQAKIDSKLPWVMGTASDLLPDPTSCEHDWQYAGTVVKNNPNGKDTFTCRKCPATKLDYLR